MTAPKKKVHLLSLPFWKRSYMSQAPVRHVPTSDMALHRGNVKRARAIKLGRKVL